MEARELRIGNIIFKDLNAQNVIVIGTDRNGSFVEWQDSTNDYVEHEGLSGIPLTEEWLLRMGFSDKDYKDGYIGIDVKMKSGTTDFVLTKKEFLGPFQTYYAWEYKCGSLPFFNQIEDVHELQNLFYAITGSELKVK